MKRFQIALILALLFLLANTAWAQESAEAPESIQSGLGTLILLLGLGAVVIVSTLTYVRQNAQRDEQEN